jgi:hypothetical protein
MFSDISWQPKVQEVILRLWAAVRVWVQDPSVITLLKPKKLESCLNIVDKEIAYILSLIFYLFTMMDGWGLRSHLLFVIRVYPIWMEYTKSKISDKYSYLLRHLIVDASSWIVVLKVLSLHLHSASDKGITVATRIYVHAGRSQIQANISVVHIYLCALALHIVNTSCCRVTILAVKCTNNVVETWYHWNCLHYFIC